ncbi:MAG: hypothetical protein OEZ25_04670 [Candidatus Bathyarchaeota archaeon]|nr:hypothetical protein [Candidatus Bathyarchaeota archaeon]
MKTLIHAGRPSVTTISGFVPAIVLVFWKGSLASLISLFLETWTGEVQRL